MIVGIKGLVVKRLEFTLIIQCNSGLSYEIYIASKSLDHLNENDDVSLFLYHHIREDQQMLFGFNDLEERQGFLTLTSVSGMGPRVASKILCHYDWNSLRNDILQANLLNLTQLPGVGKRLAERLVTELKDKLMNLGPVAIASGHNSITSSSLQQELMQALQSLGYSQNEIQQALKSIDAKEFSEDLSKNIKLVLKRLI